MNILFYISPLMVGGNPFFFEGALKKKLIPISQAAKFSGHNVCFSIPDVFKNTYFSKDIEINWINNVDLSEHLDIFGDLDEKIYKNDKNIIRKLEKYYKEKIGDKNIDLIFAWECCTDHLKKVFPEAKIVHLMPSFMSRLPYPDLIYFDDRGLFKKSKLYDQFDNIISQYKFIESDIDKLISEITSFYLSLEPIETRIKSLLDELHYDSIHLVPLQYSKHYNFKVDSMFDNQLDLLQQILKKNSKTKATIVTQYAANDINDINLTESYTDVLKETYPNLVFSESFNKIDNVSQYILPFVDEVTTCSSSIGLQALIFNKKVNVVGDTFIKKVVDYANSSTYNRKKVLSYLLENTIPFSKLRDGSTFNECINKIYGQKNNEELRESFKYERALEKVNDFFPDILIRNYIPEDLKVQILNAKVVSFDVFDTLIERPLAQPVDLFLLVEKKINEIGLLNNFKFSSARVLAEKIAKESFLDSEEITLDQIYNILKLQYNLEANILESIKDLEISFEKILMTSRPFGKMLYQFCLENNKDILFASDMYLPKEVIIELLEKNDFMVNDNLYLSSEIGLKKSTGGMFNYIRDKLNIEYSEIIHFGDNVNGDFKIPKSLGINAHRLARSVDKMFNVEFYNKSFKIRGFGERTIGESIVIYMIARRLFDNPFKQFDNLSICQNNLKNLGYILLGTCLTDFSLWLNNSAIKNGNDGLFFIARDGKVVKKVYDTVFKNNNFFTKYVYGSRKLMRNTSIPSLIDIHGYLGNMVGKIPSIELSENFGWEIFDEKLNTKINSYSELLEVFKSVSDLYALNVEYNIEQNSLLKKYLNSHSFFDCSNPAIVEIGYAGTIQNYMQRVLGNKKLTGYYYALFNTAEININKNNKMIGYVANGDSRFNLWHSIANNGFMYETLFCSDEDTIIKLSSDQDDIYAIRNADSNDKIRKDLIRKIHFGAFEYASVFADLYSDILEYIPNDRELGSRMITNFIKKPSGKDAGLFEGVIFESNFSNSTFKYVIPPRNMLDKFNKDKSIAVWRQGSEVFFRRSDVQKDNIILKAKPIFSDEKKSEFSQNKESAITNFIFNSVERNLMQSIFKKDFKKMVKYNKDSVRFFKDSKINIVRKYGDFKDKFS